jgi:hypothetical protein
MMTQATIYGGAPMGTSKTWGLVAVVVLLTAIGVFAFRYSEIVGKKPHSVTLHWDASPRATSYNVYRRTEDGAFAKIGSSQTASYVDSPVAAGTVYYYGVTTLQDQKESEISNVIRVEVPKD